MWTRSWVRKIPWRKAWQPPPFLPGESHGQRSLAGYSPQGHRELDTMERLSTADSLPCSVLCHSRRPVSIIAVNRLQRSLTRVGLPFQKSGTETPGGDVTRPSSSAWYEACLS